MVAALYICTFFASVYYDSEILSKEKSIILKIGKKIIVDINEFKRLKMLIFLENDNSYLDSFGMQFY